MTLSRLGTIEQVIAGDAPFVGWGATPVAALRRGLRFLGCEISEANRATALARIEGVDVAPTA